MTDFRSLAGTWIRNMELNFPDGVLKPEEQILVGGHRKGKPGEWFTECRICRVEVALDKKDWPVVMEHKHLVPICLDCFEKALKILTLDK